MGHAPQNEPMGWSDAELDKLFAEAAEEIAPSEAFLARVMADAEAVQTARQAPVVKPAAQLSRGFWGSLVDAFGGGGALAGMGTAALAGLYLGFAQPATLSALTFSFSAETTMDTVDLMPGIDALLAEE